MFFLTLWGCINSQDFQSQETNARAVEPVTSMKTTMWHESAGTEKNKEHLEPRRKRERCTVLIRTRKGAATTIRPVVANIRFCRPFRRPFSKYESSPCEMVGSSENGINIDLMGGSR
jgi:hypothetical protein